MNLQDRSGIRAQSQLIRLDCRYRSYGMSSLRRAGGLLPSSGRAKSLRNR